MSHLNFDDDEKPSYAVWHISLFVMSNIYLYAIHLIDFHNVKGIKTVGQDRVLNMKDIPVAPDLTSLSSSFDWCSRTLSPTQNIPKAFLLGHPFWIEKYFHNLPIFRTAELSLEVA